MGYKSYLNIEVKDAFITGNKLKQEKGIMGISVVTCQKLKVKYDNRKIQPEAIKELIKADLIKNQQ